jgi:preprotein translocase subunit SecG
MITVVLVIHLLIASALVGVILIQRSEGGALGGLGGGSFGGLMSARGGANLLTRTTAILAAGFILTSVALAVLAGQGRRGGSILDVAPPVSAPGATTPAAPAGSAAAPAPEPAAPAVPAEPSAPVAR